MKIPNCFTKFRVHRGFLTARKWSAYTGIPTQTISKYEQSDDDGNIINLPKTIHLIKYLKEGFNAKRLYDNDAPLTVDEYIHVPDEHTREYIKSRTLTYNKEEIQAAKNLSIDHEKAWYLSPSGKGKSIRAIMDFLKEKPDLFCSKVLNDMQMSWMQMKQEVPEWQK